PSPPPCRKRHLGGAPPQKRCQPEIGLAFPVPTVLDQGLLTTTPGRSLSGVPLAHSTRIAARLTNPGACVSSHFLNTPSHLSRPGDREAGRGALLRVAARAPVRAPAGQHRDRLAAGGQLVEVELDARPQGGADGRTTEVDALGGGRLELE